MEGLKLTHKWTCTFVWSHRRCHVASFSVNSKCSSYLYDIEQAVARDGDSLTWNPHNNICCYKPITQELMPRNTPKTETNYNKIQAYAGSLQTRFCVGDKRWLRDDANTLSTTIFWHYYYFWKSCVCAQRYTCHHRELLSLVESYEMTSCLISVCLFFNEIGLDTMAMIMNISADMNTFSLQIGASCQVFTIVNRFSKQQPIITLCHDTCYAGNIIA